MANYPLWKRLLVIGICVIGTIIMLPNAFYGRVETANDAREAVARGAELTPELERLTTQKFGRFQQVTPEIVLEVTFDYVQESKRHKAGYALRFPRIVRVRRDKPVQEIDTLEKVKQLAASTMASPGAGQEQ